MKTENVSRLKKYPEVHAVFCENTRQLVAEALINQKAAQKTPKRLEPTRYGDWEKNGRCIDF